MQIRCPHCHNPIELVNDDPSSDVSCPSCGSCFNLASDVETARYSGGELRTLGHFQLLHCIGTGAFGSVWKAKDTQLDRIVAVKIPRREQLTSEEVEKFLREARAAAQVKHPGIVSVYEVGREDGRIYIASEFIEGASLDQWIEAHPPTVREAAEICAQVAEALHQAHEAGVVHRDLKPSNILMDVVGQPHITDFGLAKREAGEITMTLEGQVLGTPAYMSPEQARGEGHQADRRSDVYSLGVILFRLLTGELPFRGKKQMLLVQILNDEPTRPRALDARIPHDLETICLKCLEKEPSRRFETARSLAEDLRRWLSGHAIQSRPIGRAARGWRWVRRNPVVSALTASVMLVLTVGVIVSSYFAVVASQNFKLAAKYLDHQQRIASTSIMALYFRDAMPLAEISPDGDHILIGGDDQPAKVWSTSQGTVIFELRDSGSVLAATFSPSGSRIVTATNEGALLLWDASNGQRVREIDQASRWVEGEFGNLTTERIRNARPLMTYQSVAFSPDGAKIVTGGSDNLVKLWEVESGKLLQTMSGHQARVTSVSFNADGQKMASGGDDNTVRIWDATSGSQLRSSEPSSSAIRRVAFNKMGDQIISLDSLGSLTVQDATTGTVIRNVAFKSTPIELPPALQEVPSLPSRLGESDLQRQGFLIGR